MSKKVNSHTYLRKSSLIDVTCNTVLRSLNYKIRIINGNNRTGSGIAVYVIDALDVKKRGG